MITTKPYEILPSLPPYGPMHIAVTHTGTPFYSEGFPVRFYKTDNTDWVANFQPGHTGLKQIVELKNTSNLIVIAGGACYLMNPNDTKPVSVLGVDYIHLFRASNDRLVLQDSIGLTIIEDNGFHWDTERISWDGLTEIAVNNNVISGLAYALTHNDDEWVPFSYNLNTKTLNGGSYITQENKKPWWKIWE